MAVEKPTQGWQELKDEERRKLEAGEISADDCHAAQLYPDAFVTRTDALLDAFAAEVARCSTSAADYPRVMKSIETLVLALNAVNDDFDGAAIETGEREELCAYMNQVIAERGIDVDALAAAQGCGRYELTDAWREW